jgi:hypothetical protein
MGLLDTCKALPVSIGKGGKKLRSFYNGMCHKNRFDIVMLAAVSAIMDTLKM